ncbi:hypothetical protein K1719_014546 [Acacia pycnantha]|nr:hypothetical protein K1719_014546 [Acacia pycnantha]
MKISSPPMSCVRYTPFINRSILFDLGLLDPVLPSRSSPPPPQPYPPPHPPPSPLFLYDMEEEKKQSRRTVIFNKYEMGRLLGQGNFAKVYYGRNLETYESDAIKVIMNSSLRSRKEK